MKLNLVLKIAIIDKFGTQVDCALAVGIREERMSRIIRERVDPRSDEKQRIAAALEMDEAKLWKMCDQKRLGHKSQSHSRRT